MTSSARRLDLLRCCIDHVEVACDLAGVASVLTREQCVGMTLLDLGELLGLPKLTDRQGGHVALLAQRDGPPVGLYIGQIRPMEQRSAREVIFLQDWLHPLLCDHLAPAAFYDQKEDRLIWLLRLETLLRGYCP